MEYFRGSEGAEFGRNLLDSVKNNPLPAALTGIGLTWLMSANQHSQPSNHGRVTSARSSGGTYWRTVDEFDDHLRTTEAAVARLAEEDELAHRERVNEARAKVLGVSRVADENSESFGQRIQDAIAATKDSLTQAARGLGDKASTLKDKATTTVSQATS
jgi:hypothetical protein